MTPSIYSATRLTILPATWLTVLLLSLAAPNPTKAEQAITIGSSSTASNTSGSTASSTNSTNGPNFSVVNSNSDGAATSGSGSSSTAVSSIQGVNITTTSTGNGTGNSGNGNGSSGPPTSSTPQSSSANSTITVSNEGTSSIKTAPPIAAPPLIATMTDNCMGSYSAGVSIVGFGATGGKTKVDEDCVRRLDAREFRALGMNDVAFALLLQGKNNHLAAEAANQTNLAPDK